MRIDEPTVSITPTRVTILGTGLFSWRTTHPRVRIAIPRVPDGSAPAPTTLEHFTVGGARGAAYHCAFTSPSFRTVQLEEAREQAVTRFSSYDTGSLPSGGPARSLTVAAAFGEAGVEMVSSGEPTVVDTSGAGADAAWSDAELHAAMEGSFSRWGDRQRWAIWLLHAVTHEDPDLFGLMFDHFGLQRQGCAVFYQGLTPADPEIARALIRVVVHELGHGFNLPHCWQRTLSAPPLPSRPAARSWMNYPDRFPGGRRAYFSKFAFEFDDYELVHLRHAFREGVIMGGAPFVGSAFDRSERWDSERRDQGLRLTLQAPRAVVQGVPVTIGLELSATTRTGRLVAPVLGPRAGTIEVAIRDPRSKESVFEPMLLHCRGDKLVPLRANDPPIRDHAFIYYGRGGYLFVDPGRYRARARYTAPDGSLALSDEVPIDVRRAASAAEIDVVKLTYGNPEVGALMSVVGSDAPGLRSGNEALQTIIGRYPRHPVADIARVIRGVNLTRRFKLIEPDGTVKLRNPQIAEAAALLTGVIDIAQLPRIVTRPGVAPAVNAYISSRRREIGHAMAVLAQAPPRGRRVPDEPSPRARDRRPRPTHGPATSQSA